MGPQRSPIGATRLDATAPRDRSGWLAAERAACPGSEGPGEAAPGREPIGAPSPAGQGGLARGALHEWFGLGPAGGPDRPGPPSPRRSASPLRRTVSEGPARRWVPPIAAFVHLAFRSLVQADACGEAGYVAWIGRRIWPYPQALLAVGADGRDGGPGPPDLVRRSLFVDPPGDAERLWAIDLALRCPAFAVVIADGVGLAMPQSRRLQLAAATGRAVGLLARAPEEWDVLSAAATRWWVGRAAAKDAGAFTGPRWRLTLWRCKGRQKRTDHGRAGDLPRSWVLEQDRAQGALRLAADVVDRPDQTPAATAFIERNRRTA